jgi:hypothetical protein
MLAPTEKTQTRNYGILSLRTRQIAKSASSENLVVGCGNLIQQVFRSLDVCFCEWKTRMLDGIAFLMNWDILFIAKTKWRLANKLALMTKSIIFAFYF